MDRALTFLLFLVILGALRYPSVTSSWQLGDVDLGEHLDHCRDQQLVVIIAPIGPREPDTVVCGICGFVMDRVGECPRCKLMVEELAEGLARRQAEQALMQEIEDHLAGLDDDQTRSTGKTWSHRPGDPGLALPAGAVRARAHPFRGNPAGR